MKNMIRMVACLTASLLVFPVLRPLPAMAQVTAETQFFTAIADIPLMDGLTEIPARDASFDKPEGRIVEASAVAAKGIDQGMIDAFYRAALPSLGWTRTEDGAFARSGDNGGETLTMKTGVEKGFATVRFTVAPR